MMSRWFRFYADAMRNPKVAKLSDAEFRLWVKLLAVASENDGSIPALDGLKSVLNTRIDRLSKALNSLVMSGLIDELSVGYEPHNWAKFQYKSDTSTARVTLHRKRKETLHETAPDTETDTETDTEVPLAKANGASHDPNKIFWDNAKAFLQPHLKGDPGKLVGKWLRENGKELTIGAITAAQLERAANPLEYIPGYFRRHGNGDDGQWGGLSVPC